MQESHQKAVTLRINASEEEAFMDRLKFMYCGTLSTSIPELLMNLMVIADKFDVVSCIRQCSLLLSSFPLTPACASQYLEFPNKTLDAAQYFTDAAKQYLAEH
ncbi:hypothetical protein AMTRI_Chr06g192320 [Amborella trichopoda]